MASVPKWTREQIEECVALAKQRFKDRYTPEVARSWANMEYAVVKDYLENAIPETIIVRGMDKAGIEKHNALKEDIEREANEHFYGLRMSERELKEYPEIFEDAQREVNLATWGIRCTDDELLTKHADEVVRQIQAITKGAEDEEI